MLHPYSVLGRQHVIKDLVRVEGNVGEIKGTALGSDAS